MIDLSGLSGITGYRDLVRHHLTRSDEAIVIAGAKGETLTLALDGIADSKLHRDDFQF